MTVIDRLYTIPYRQLTVEDEQTLICAARDGDEDAMLQLLRNYLPTILNAAHKRYHPAQRTDARWEDIVSVAIESTVRLVHTVDLTRTHRLAGMLGVTLRRELSEVVLPARVPHAIAWRYHRARTLAAGAGDAVTWETDGRTKAKDVGLSEDVYGAVDALYHATPLDAGDTADARTPAALIRVEVLEDTASALDALDPRSRVVIETLYGIGGEALSSRKAAEVLGISRTTVGRIAKSALQTMRVALGA